MYEYNYNYDGSAITGGATILAGMMIFVWIFTMLICALFIVCLAKIFKKAGKPWWAAIIPIYNMIVMTEIAGLPAWYVALMFVPVANIYAVIKIMI